MKKSRNLKEKQNRKQLKNKSGSKIKYPLLSDPKFRNQSKKERSPVQ